MYSGYRYFDLTDDDFAKVYSNQTDFLSLQENEYALLRELKDNTPQIKDILVKQGDEISSVRYQQLETQYSGIIKPRNIEQQCAFHMLQNNDIRVKVLTGCYGSGKDFLMVNLALEQIRQKKFDKLVYVRNNIEVKDTAPLGTLPGSAFEKLYPFIMPLADHVGGDAGLEYLMSNDFIEVQHLGHIRGRDIKRSIILSSEAENLTTKHVQLLLGRVGEGSALWLNGDHKQTDKEIFRTNSGLKAIVDKLQGHRLFGYVHLTKSERSEVASLADLLD